jgi:hypothetical protein
MWRRLVLQPSFLLIDIMKVNESTPLIYRVRNVHKNCSNLFMGPKKWKDYANPHKRIPSTIKSKCILHTGETYVI